MSPREAHGVPRAAVAPWAIGSAVGAVMPEVPAPADERCPALRLCVLGINAAAIPGGKIILGCGLSLRAALVAPQPEVDVSVLGGHDTPPASSARMVGQG